MRIAGHTLPDKCPDDCPFSGETYRGFCKLCPVYRCAGEEVLMPPEQYRKDWAKEWARWFRYEMVGYPKLPT